MKTVFILNVLAIFFSYLESRKILNHGLAFTFGLIFIFLALRYNFGNDYINYLDKFLAINSFSTDSIGFFDQEYMEKAWIYLNLVFGQLGFFSLVALLALFNCYVYYHVIKKYVPPRYYWFAVFLYVFEPSFMLTHLSAMRQSLAIGIFLLSLDYLFRKKPIGYFSLVFIASLFHSSALIVAPLYFLTIIKDSKYKLISLILLILYFLAFFLEDVFPSHISSILGSIDTFERYGIYLNQDSVEINTGFGILYSTLLFLLLFYYERLEAHRNSILLTISLINLIFVPLSLFVPMLSRISMYFSIINILSFPHLIAAIRKPILTKITMGAIIFMTIYNLIIFFKSPIFHESYTQYQTIFSAPSLY